MFVSKVERLPFQLLLEKNICIQILGYKPGIFVAIIRPNNSYFCLYHDQTLSFFDLCVTVINNSCWLSFFRHIHQVVAMNDTPSAFKHHKISFDGKYES